MSGRKLLTHSKEQLHGNLVMSDIPYCNLPTWRWKKLLFSQKTTQYAFCWWYVNDADEATWSGDVTCMTYNLLQECDRINQRLGNQTFILVLH